MNESEIVGRVARRMGLSKFVAEGAVDTVLASIGEALAKNEDVRIAGFGKFATRNRPARTGRNPAIGESVAIPASRTPAFKAGRWVRMVRESPGTAMAACIVPSPSCRWSGTAADALARTTCCRPAHGHALPLGGERRASADRGTEARRGEGRLAVVARRRPAGDWYCGGRDLGSGGVLPAGRRHARELGQALQHNARTIETFVETPRYPGAVYKESGWTHVGTTQGRGRYDRGNLYDKPRKDVWFSPLRKQWKRTLNR